MADISKAFLWVGLQEEDRNYTKFLWIKDPNNPNSELITYSNNLYVDNFQGTTSSESKLLNICHETNRELLGAKMTLQSWVSNNISLNQLIESEFSDYKVPQKTKVLGVEWDTAADQLTIKSVEPDTTNITMRKLLSQISKSFDPAGLLSPILINGQLIMQEC
ncbi:uncharacterized protein [Procambarus clarkii]|uniref:uncharacterized protein n=1 Tax=Procambarus clarkii TaxID=6728 RepID=UPI0037443B5D